MSPEIAAVEAERIAGLRERHCEAMGAQIVRWSWLTRGFVDAFEIRVGTRRTGYALVGGAPGEARNGVVELFAPEMDSVARSVALERVVEVTRARRVLAQTNDQQLHSAYVLLRRTCRETHVLFAAPAGVARPGEASGATFRRLEANERAGVFRHESEPVGEWCVEAGGEVVATGGYLTHYNEPWVDVHMEVASHARLRGYGSMAVAGVVREAWLRGLRCAARCRVENEASARCLARAGMKEAGRLIEGEVGARV